MYRSLLFATIFLSACGARASAEAPEAVPGCPDADAIRIAAAAVGVDGDALEAALGREGLIVVAKEQRRIGVYDGGALTESEGDPACWSVGLAMGYPDGPKRREGDMRTPEGLYATSDKPWSSFYAAIAVHYPNENDAAAGVEAGIISESKAGQIRSATRLRQKPDQVSDMGGEILIHGGGGDSDWTLGCVAMDDPEIDALRALLPAGVRTDVLILP